MVQDRSPPEGAGIVCPPLCQELVECMKVDVQGAFHEGEDILPFQGLEPQGVLENPEGLADRVPPFLAAGFGPEEGRHLVSGDRFAFAGNIDQDSHWLALGKGDRIAILVQDLGGTEDTELVGQENLRLVRVPAGSDPLPIPGVRGVDAWGRFSC
jgi:hypothetical protein